MSDSEEAQSQLDHEWEDDHPHDPSQDYDERFYSKADKRFDRVDKTQLAPQLQPLRDSLADKKPPYCAGALPVRGEELVLYYGKDKDNNKRLDFVHVSEDELQHLSSICDPASFGLGQKDVLDETYRKAGKLDSTYFATKIDVTTGLLDAVRFDLLPGHQCQRQIKFELYKLNVYGESMFFKAHKDTPRGASMFGSLVIILPTQHKGGELLLRHDGGEWTFDSAQAVSKHSSENPLIAYTAFFSDVEHEVLTVTSGHRVTITYNLYFVDEGTDATGQMVKTLPPVEASFLSALKGLLDDPTFLPEGGYIGFGLHHEYPTETQPARTMTLNRLKKCLKGCDAVILKVCQDLGLDVQVKMYYNDEGFGLLFDREPDFSDLVCDEDALWSMLRKYAKGKIVEKPFSEYGGYNDVTIDSEILWATKRTPFNHIKSTFGACGNEMSLFYVYGQFCVVIPIGPVGNRATAKP